MEISFKWPSFYFCLLCFQLCNGNPITSNNTEIDASTKLLTGIISLLLTVCFLVFLAACLCCQRRKNFEVQDPEKVHVKNRDVENIVNPSFKTGTSNKFRNSPVIASSIADFDHGHVNPIANGEFTIFSPLSPPHFNNNVFHVNDETKTRTVEDSTESCYDIRSWFNSSEKDFPRNRLKYIKELGTGWFGKVVQGAAQDPKDTEQSWTPVVVRILDATSSQKEKVLFLQEAAIYRISSHTNILSLVGRSLETVPFLLLQEYCPQGDLKRYLQSNKADAEKLLSTEYPLIWCCQLTSALKHIHENNTVHLDLAGRNCQLTPNLTLKLGDYGLGPYLYPGDYYQGLHTVPVRWCAPESLVCTQTTIQPKKVTPEGNVWSLGVTMWEICECGEQPYKGLSDDEVISHVLGSSNVRLGRPTYSALYTDYIFRLMQSCWTSLESRPTVSQIDTMLTDLLQVHRNTSYGEFDRRWESSKPNTIVKTDIIIEPLLTPEINLKKSLSPSLNKLHGSLDDLAEDTKIMLENEIQNDSLTSHRTSVSDISDPDILKKESKLEFNLTSNSLFQRTTSSGSETEDENWRNKVERGAYTEKVRQKSKSVTDLMVLTHVDCSESEPDTPLPSLDYRVNYRNVRLAGLEGPGNLENANLTFGSEGNLLSVQDTFQEELRKLQEERRDSLPFVPDTFSQSSFSNNKLSTVASPSKLMQELNSSVDIKPANQVYNVYNVTIDNFSPITVHKKLEEIIDFKSDKNQDMRVVDCNTLLNHTNGSESCDNLKKDDFTEISEPVNLGNESVQGTYEAVNWNVKSESNSIKEHENMFTNTSKDVVNQINDSFNEIENQICQKLEKPDISENVLNENDETATLIKNNARELVDKILEASIEKIISIEKKIQIEDDKVSSIVQSDIEDSDIKEENDKELEREVCHNVPKEISVPDEKTEGESKIDKILNSIILTNEVTRTENVIEDIKETKETICKDPEEQIISEVNKDHLKEDESMTEKINKPETVSGETVSKKYNVPKLSDIILDNKNLMDLVARDSNEESQEENEAKLQMVNFDLSLEQDEAMPNSLTHSTFFTSTPFRKREISLSSENKFSSINLFSVENHDKGTNSPSGLNYSLETWDNFLGTTLDNQNDHLENMFDSFSSEPQSLLFIEGDKCVEEREAKNSTELVNKDNLELTHNINATYNLESEHNLNNDPNGTYDLEVQNADEVLNGTYDVKKDAQIVRTNNEEGALNSTYPKERLETLQNTSEDPNVGTFENGCGWFLHPQQTNDLCGDMQIQSPCTDSYIGFGIDDEVMSAIRNELLTKLPHAQGASADRVREEEDWDTCERNEVFLRYNVYNIPLSPIPEESYTEDHSPMTSPKLEREIEDVEWSGRTDTDTLTHDIESNSAQTLESPLRSQFNRHTPSQDSCCSNDTLFNLEELICATTDLEKDSEILTNFVINEIDLESTYVKDRNHEDKKNNSVELEVSNKTFINEFLTNERNFSIDGNKLKPPNTLNLSDKQMCPLPSPEDNPWKQLPASELNFQNVTSNTHLSLDEKPEDDSSGKEKDVSLDCDTYKSAEENLTFTKDKPDVLELPSSSTSGHKMESLDNSLSIEDVPLDEDYFENKATLVNIIESVDTTIQENQEHFESIPDDLPIPSFPLNVKIEEEQEHLKNEPGDAQKPSSPKITDSFLVIEGNVLEGEHSKNKPDILCRNTNNLEHFKNESNISLSVTNNQEHSKDESNISLLVTNNQEHSKNEQNVSPSVTNKQEHPKNEPDKYLSATYNQEHSKNEPVPSPPSSVDKMTSAGSSLSLEDDAPLDQEHSDKENIEPIYENSGVDEPLYENELKIDERIHKNIEPNKTDENKLYENSDIGNNEELYKITNSEIDSYEDYVNIVNMENDKNRLECDMEKDNYINIYGHEEEVHSEDENIYGILTDIRFTGPSDNQMMSTSFSENIDEQGWESGSDSRSSSSGEFIWKEGEHEESLKALTAAPHDVLENMKPMEGIVEDACEESDVSSSFTDDEETPEFVPSAWDKFAIPSKSALRSPEKTLNKSDERKPKGVWFKKQKYHCIYEYPKEPESPVLQSQDLWKPQPDIRGFADWEFDGEVFVPSQASDDTTNYTNRTNSILSSQNLYHLTSITDLIPDNSSSTNSDGDFFISSSTQPFHSHNLSSQFFPGNSSWTFENATPDSGVEDITPGSITDSNEYTSTIPTLKQLASEAAVKKKLTSSRNNEVMGGLRHTRNRLKLDLPPSPSAFTTDKPWFYVDPLPSVELIREKPSFTTFGKSRFMVQHVDTPPDENLAKNVSFEALPYQPLNPVITDHSDSVLERSLVKDDEDDKCKLKVEVVRGEASLLDSGDEDSGIESASTLERKITNSQL